MGVRAGSGFVETVATILVAMDMTFAVGRISYKPSVYFLPVLNVILSIRADLTFVTCADLTFLKANDNIVVFNYSVPTNNNNNKNYAKGSLFLSSHCPSTSLFIYM